MGNNSPRGDSDDAGDGGEVITGSDSIRDGSLRKGGVDAPDGRDTDVAAGVSVGVDGDLPVQGDTRRESTVDRLDRLGVIRRCACGCGNIITGGGRQKYFNANHRAKASRARKVKVRRAGNRGRTGQRAEKWFYLYREAAEKVMDWMQGRDWTTRVDVVAWGGLNEWVFDAERSEVTRNLRFAKVMKALVGAKYLELREEVKEYTNQWDGKLHHKVRSWRIKVNNRSR